MEIIGEKIYEKYSMPERAKIFNEWYKTAKCKCECGRVVLYKNITRHRKTAPHLNYLEKNKN
jgi:hypothetical protein